MKDTTVFKYIENFYIENSSISSILAAVIVLIIDYITGKHVQFPILYVLPAAMAAWSNSKIQAYGLAVSLPIIRICFNFLWGEVHLLYFNIINAILRVAALSFYVYLIDILASQTRALQKEVKILEGILPICASCKKIRTSEGKYESVEKYITEHSEAVFSHGLCQECAEKLYPEYFNKKD